MAKKAPQRQCLGCREQKDKKSMLRIIRKEDDTYMLDPTGKMNGRGAYICPKEECLKKAILSKALDRSFKTSIPDTVYEALREELRQLEEQ